ncbi:MAG: class II glutamine amidotransferase [Candidatus Omnitrophica bacterium]|nr:class II glutamine amidotransferase [Candidatus Omnitrophota bacterium]
MCQILGVSSNKRVDIQFSLKEFKKRGEENPHGFGFVFYNENNDPKLIKNPSSLKNESIEEKKYKFKSKIIIGHVRLASCGKVSHENTHPFLIKNWSFAHNGTVREVKNWQLNKFKPKGETDSEYAFCYLLDKIYNIAEIDEVADILKREALMICKLGRFNFLLSDGEYLYAYGDDSLYFVKREPPFQEVTLKDDGYHLHLKEIKDPDEKAIIIATKPLTKEENWQKIRGLKLFKYGEQVELI